MKKMLEPAPMRVGVAAHKLGLHPFTVRRWIKQGKINALRVGNEARIPAAEIARLMGKLPKSIVVLYGRVSGHDQQDDLQSQMEALRTWAKQERPGREIVELSDIGSGLKADRKQLRRMLSMIQNDQVAEVVVTYADRLTRFGLEYLTLFFAGYDVRLTVLHPNDGKTPEQELTDDLIAILTSFSGRHIKKLDNKVLVRYTRGVKNLCSHMEPRPMGQASRTTKLLLDLGNRTKGGANTEKRAALDATAEVLNQARAFYLDFFLAHADKLAEKVTYYSQEHLELRERPISAHELLSWAEACTVATAAHPHPWSSWNFTQAFPGMPCAYRRSVIKDAIGKARSYFSSLARWERSGKKKGQPGWPAATNHPTLYQGCIALELEVLDTKESYVRINVYTKEGWKWLHYPVCSSRYLVKRLKEADWRRQSPTLVLRVHAAELHIPQSKHISARKVLERKQDPDLVTVAVDLNVKNLAVITVRQHDRIIETVFVCDHGLDAHRYRHLKRIAKKQWQSGRSVTGEHSNRQLWRHVDRLNEDAAHKVARQIASVCAKYPECILLFERLRKIKQGPGSKSRRMNRRRANQLRGKIREHAKDKAYVQQIVTVEVNPHGTSQYCSRCGAKGERFSYQQGQRVFVKWGTLFYCAVCHYEANAYFNASANVHHAFYREWHWLPRRAKGAPPSVVADGT